MRSLIVWSFCLAVMPWAAFGQANRWDSAVNAAMRAYRQQRYRDAESQFVEAEKEAETFGPYDHRMGVTLNNLAELYRREARYNEAESLFKRALDIWTKSDESTPNDKATALNNLTALYSYQIRYGDAEPLYQQCLALREKTLGPDHPDVASGLNNLAELYRSEKKYAEAVPLYQRALAIVYTNLSNLYQLEGKHRKARKMADKAKTFRNQESSPS